MSLIITPQSEIDKYFESEALNQSTLKILDKGLQTFLDHQKAEKEGKVSKRNFYYEEKGGFIIGSALDVLLTGEEGIFDKLFYTSNLSNKPSDVEMSIITMVYDSVTDKDVKDLENYPELILKAATIHNWQARYKPETKVNKLVEAGNDFFNELRIKGDRQLLSVEEKTTIDKIYDSLISHSRTSKYFDRQKIEQDNNIKIYYQFPLYFKLNGIECKALFDILVFMETENGPIILPVDLKTTYEPTIKFDRVLRKFRYDLQGAWYTIALKTVYPDHKIANFKFIVESSTNPGKPLIFEMSNSLLEIGTSGRKAIYTEDRLVQLKPEIKGVIPLIKDYKYYSDTGWIEEKVVSENAGILTLNWDGIISV